MMCNWVHELPPGLTDPTSPGAGPAGFVAVLQQESCTLDGLTATCELGDLARGGVATLTFTGRVPTTAADGTIFTDTATITANGDTEPSNNSATGDVTVQVQPTTTTTATSTTTPTTTSPTTTTPSSTVAANTTTTLPSVTATTRPNSGGGRFLPSTGTTVAGILVVGAALLALGGGLRLAGTRRRQPRS